MCLNNLNQEKKLALNIDYSSVFLIFTITFFPMWSHRKDLLIGLPILAIVCLILSLIKQKNYFRSKRDIIPYKPFPKPGDKIEFTNNTDCDADMEDEGIIRGKIKRVETFDKNNILVETAHYHIVAPPQDIIDSTIERK